ncbi:MAG: TetR/AcrR family transcriptional regulator [Paenibacillus sp.]|nr:TetR/AcrR family transcriptional regulator [Paenibacillus sp.]
MLRNSRKQVFKEHIFMQAMKLFNEKGFDRVTVDEITQVSGVAKGTFYNYFPKKEAVLLYLGHSQMDLLHESIRKHSTLPKIQDRLLEIFCDLTARYSEQSELLRLALSEMVRSPALMNGEMESIRQFHSAMLPWLDEAKTTGQMASHIDDNLAATLLQNIYFQSLLEAISGDTALNTQELRVKMQQQLELIWLGLAPR